MLHTPTARQEGLIVNELEDETLVYDLERDEAHCLNQTAALVWKYCDGRTTVKEIATRVGIELKETIDPKVVWLALAQLRKKKLLAERLPRPASGLNRPRISRRELALKLGRVMVIALPLITTIAAPMPASAVSCGNCGPGGPIPDCCGAGCPCQGPSICCSGVCSAGSCT